MKKKEQRKTKKGAGGIKRIERGARGKSFKGQEAW